MWILMSTCKQQIEATDFKKSRLTWLGMHKLENSSTPKLAFNFSAMLSISSQSTGNKYIAAD